MSKNLSKYSWVVSAMSVVLPILASADATIPPSPATDISGVFAVACTIFRYLFLALIFAAVFFVLMAAFKYLTGGGNPDKVKEANKDLLFAVVAVVVGLVARYIPNIAASIVGVTGGGAICP